MEFDKNNRVKEEALSVAKLNAKLKQKMKEDMVTSAVENAKKMSIILKELRASNAKMGVILEMLSKMQSFVAAPQPRHPFLVEYPFRYPPNGSFSGGPSYKPTPHPTPVGILPPPTMLTDTTIHDAILTAIGEDKDSNLQ